MRKIPYDNVALLALAAVFSVVATVVLSGFLEPSQPPAVAAVEIGAPQDEEARARERAERPRAVTADRRRAEKGRAERSQAEPRQGAAPAQESRPAERRQGAATRQETRPATQPDPAPPLPLAPAEPDDDTGEPTEADDDPD